MILAGRRELVKIEHNFDKRARIEAIEYPELNGSDEVFDKDTEIFISKPIEQHKRIKLGFYQANIISQLRANASHLYIIILYNTGRNQSTYITNEKLSKYSGLSVNIIGKKKNSLLNELEYWHLIERHYIPNPWNREKKSRVIVVLRWDTARELLLKENKIIKVDNGYRASPNPYKLNH